MHWPKTEQSTGNRSRSYQLTSAFARYADCDISDAARSVKPAVTDFASPQRSCDASSFRAMLDAALRLLEQRAEAINDLNVFPVPDGDTGTNMLLTMRAAMRATTEPDLSDVRSLSNALAHGAFMGGRGNA